MSLRSRLREWRIQRDDQNFPLRGYTDNRVTTQHIEALTDKELEELNGLLRWHCFTVDSQGRRFGRRSKPGKREAPQAVPDTRIVELDRRIPLRGKSVLEIGCFEGVHTIGLAMMGAQVTAVDSRVENVVKTVVRTALFGIHPTVFKCDVEVDADARALQPVDIIHHVGVLYHLTDPAGHLQKVATLAASAIMLDTHYAEPHEARDTYVSNNKQIPYRRLNEGGRSDVFSGMYDHAKWLTLETIEHILAELGFTHFEVAEKRAERNGPRALIFASR